MFHPTTKQQGIREPMLKQRLWTHHRPLIHSGCRIIGFRVNGSGFLGFRRKGDQRGSDAGFPTNQGFTVS